MSFISCERKHTYGHRSMMVIGQTGACRKNDTIEQEMCLLDTPLNLNNSGFDLRQFDEKEDHDDDEDEDDMFTRMFSALDQLETKSYVSMEIKYNSNGLFVH
eukprot:669286_1